LFNNLLIRSKRRWHSDGIFFFYVFNSSKNNRLVMVLHKIIIVGGGAGGLELATQLGNTFSKSKKAEVILIDQNSTHIWKPKLHEIASGSMNAALEETNYLAHAAKHHYKFIRASFIGLNASEKTIQLEISHSIKGEKIQKHTCLHYDTLILAVGSTSNDFGTTGVKEHCYLLDSRQQAEYFHEDFVNKYWDAQHSADHDTLDIAIIGAGATGVELSAELSTAKDTLFKYGLNKIDPKKVHIHLIEAANRILPALPELVAERTTQQLFDLNIEIHTKQRVSAVDATHVHFSDGSKIAAEMVVWSAGIQAPKVIRDLTGFEKDKMQRLKVYATLQTLADPNIFALGDCAHCQPRADEPVLAPRAQVASQQAAFLVNAMKARIQGQALPMFSFADKGSLISLSHRKAVGELMGYVNVQGLLAKAVYVSLYRLHLATIHGYTYTGALTVRDLLTKNFGPKLKLH
jgi:NADH:ubiquinone reductase (H+-translocating)